MNYRSDQGYNHYDAVNVRWSATNLINKGLNLTANYTWSHSLDNLSSTFTEQFGGYSGAYQLGYLDAFNAKLNYGNSDYDIPNRFVFSGVWELPWLKNSSNAVARNVVGGWAIGSIFKARSGSPYSIYDCSNANDTGCPLWVPSQPTPNTGSNQGMAGNNLYNYMMLPNNGGIPVNLDDSLGTPNCTGLYHTPVAHTPPAGCRTPDAMPTSVLASGTWT